MHNVTTDTRRSAPIYRERLSPSVWALVSAAVAGPMVGLVFVAVDSTLALALGLLVGVGLVVALVFSSPIVEITENELRVGVARIAHSDLGEARGLTGGDARHARGPGLPRNAWHMLRGGIDGLVVVPVVDSDDPAPAWVFSTRTPERITALLARYAPQA